MCAKRKKKRIKKGRHLGNLWYYRQVRSVKRQRKILIKTGKFDEAMFLRPSTEPYYYRYRDLDAKSTIQHHSTYQRFIYRIWAAWKKASLY